MSWSEAVRGSAGLGDVRGGVACRPGEQVDYLAESADQRRHGVGAAGFAQDGLGGAGDLGLSAVEVELVENGVDVQQHEHDVASVTGVEGDLGELVVAA